MKLKTIKLIIIMMCYIILLSPALTWGTSVSSAAEKKVFSGEAAHKAEMMKILSFLENKMDDQKLLEKTKIKLFGLNNAKIHLIASLCDRTAGNNNAGADIVFSLVTALIILS